MIVLLNLVPVVITDLMSRFETIVIQSQSSYFSHKHVCIC